MIIEPLIGRVPGMPGSGRLVFCAVFTALAISLGMVGIATLAGISIGPALPSALGAVGAAWFAVHAQRRWARRIVPRNAGARRLEMHLSKRRRS